MSAAQASGPAARAAQSGWTAALAWTQAAVCIAALAWGTPVRAASLFDPALRFRMIRTDHFIIYVHQGDERRGERLASIAEETWRALRQPLGVNPPRRTQVVLADQTELPNGYATPLPYDTIVIYPVWPPGADFLGDADDWLRVAFTHEFTHIVHLDRSQGWAHLVRDVFGRVTVAFPNLFLPTWQIEGLAVYEESALTGQGRLHAGDFTAVIGEAARTHTIAPLDRINGGLTDWPNGNAPYAYGLGFHEYLARRFGTTSLGALAARTAGSIPYTGSRAFRQVFGESLGDLWRDYDADLSAAEEAAPPARPATPSLRRITHQGFIVSGPRFDRASPRDVIYASRTADEFPSLYRVSIEDRQPHRIARQYVGTTAAPGRTAIYFDQLELRRNVGSYSDLYALTRTTGHVSALTRDARVLEPDLSPDETALVAVQNRSAGRAVVLIRVTTDRARSHAAMKPVVDVFLSEADAQFDAPRWSPDGRQIAVERHRLGSLSELVVIDLATRAVRVVGSLDGARIVTPAWTPDGRALIVAVAPENQPFNLFEYAIDGSGPPRRLTSLSGGATWPDVSPDGKTIAFVGYTADGFDVFTMDYPAPSARDGDPLIALPPSPRTVRGDGSTEADRLPATDYNPLPTLAPTSWSPILQTSGSQVRVGAALAGADVLGYHLYSASATWLASGPSGAIVPSNTAPDWQLAYLYDRWQPTLFAAASSQTSFFAGPPADNGTPTNTTLREHLFEAGVLFPIVHARTSHTALLSAVRAIDDYTEPGQLFSRNRTAARAAWLTTTAHSYGYSISPEQGVTVGSTIEMVRRALGSSADATIATADVRAYLPGLADHQVIALRAAAGLSTGDPTVGRTFLLGGSVTDLGAASFSSSAIGLLRGFPANTFAGSHVGVFNADYRFPIARPQRGYGTWPLFLHTLHGAVFADAGHAWTRTFSSDAIQTSVGAELSADLVAGYVFPVTVSVGSGWGRDRSGVVGDQWTAYVRIGKAF